MSPARTKCRRLQTGGYEETRLEDDLEERSLQSVLNLAQQQLELEAQVAELFSNSAQMSGNVLNLNWGRSRQKKCLVCLPYLEFSNILSRFKFTFPLETIEYILDADA